MKLTAKQEAFCQAIADGLNQSDAYRKAYESQATDKTVNEEASKVMANPKVSTRVAQLKGALEEKALWTRQESVEALSKIAKGSDKGSEIVAAVKELNAMHGYQAPTKSEHTFMGGVNVLVRFGS